MRRGEALPPVVRTVAQENISLYAHASGDHNPIHLDEEFAARSQFGRIVAHGMLVLAYVSEMMALAFGRRWLESGQLSVHFRAPVYPGDTVSTFGEVVEAVESDGAIRLRCSVGCRRQGGDEVINGEAWVTMPGENGEVA